MPPATPRRPSRVPWKAAVKYLHLAIFSRNIYMIARRDYRRAMWVLLGFVVIGIAILFGSYGKTGLHETLEFWLTAIPLAIGVVRTWTLTGARLRASNRPDPMPNVHWDWWLIVRYFARIAVAWRAADAAEFLRRSQPAPTQRRPSK